MYKEQLDKIVRTLETPNRTFFYCQPQLYYRVKAMSGTNSNLNAVDSRRVLQLLENLTGLNSAAIQSKINQFLQEQTKFKMAFQMILLDKTDEAVVQALGEMNLEKEMRFPISKTSTSETDRFERELSEVIKSRCYTCTSTSNLYAELIATGVESDSMCFIVPIMHPNDHQVAIIVCLVDGACETENFDNLSQIVTETFRYCCTLVLNTFAYEEELRLKRQCQTLLAVARKLFSHLGDLNDLLKEIMSEARRLTKAERCSLFLVDPDDMHLVAKVFDGLPSKDCVQEVRLMKGQGIAGYVAATGKVKNIRDAYKEPLFYKRMDETTGFKTRNILCFPICDENGIVGVAQLCNKKDGLYFDVFDEEVAMAFSIYCGISIMHSLVYKKIQDTQMRNKLSNELMMYHMKVNPDDVIRLVKCIDEHEHNFANFSGFECSPRDIPREHTPCYVFKMFTELGFVEKFDLKRESLARFILFVQKGYRDPPYHNWLHAFSVAHFAYLCIYNFKLVDNNYLTDLEALACLTSCLCHDLDHRGTNNSFQAKTGSVLASLYSSEGSVMERHHLSQTICILNTEGCNFLEQLKNKDYVHCLDCIRDNILATDLANHCRIFKEQQDVFQEGYDKSNSAHKTLLMSLLMTAADLSDQTKDWVNTRRIADLVYTEFFTQGDLEKAMGNKPLEMMDRERAFIPDLQLQFLNTIVIPVFELLSREFGVAEKLVTQIYKNALGWEKTRDKFLECQHNGDSAIMLLRTDVLDRIVQTSDEK